MAVMEKSILCFPKYAVFQENPHLSELNKSVCMLALLFKLKLLLIIQRKISIMSLTLAEMPRMAQFLSLCTTMIIFNANLGLTLRLLTPKTTLIRITGSRNTRNCNQYQKKEIKKSKTPDYQTSNPLLISASQQELPKKVIAKNRSKRLSLLKTAWLKTTAQ